MIRKPRFALLAVLVGVGLAAIAPPALASNRPADGTGSPTTAGSAEIHYKAGYTVTSLEELTTATATFRLPKLRCGDETETTEAASIGLGSEPVFGRFKYLAVVHLTCEHALHYFLNAHVKPHRRAARSNAHEGERIRVSITQEASGAVLATVENLSTGIVVQQRGKPKGLDSDVDFGAFPLFLYDDMVEVPDFDPVLINKAKVGTDAGDVCIGETTTVTNVREDQETGEVEIAPGPLSGCEFSLEFRSHLD